MRLLRVWRKLQFLARRREFDAALEEEMRFHLDMAAGKDLVAGLSPEEARYAAQRRFGNATLAREASREFWGWAWLDRLGQDLRYALRTLRANPGFTTVVVLTLALGIGANTAVFTLVDAVLLKSLPVKNPEELYVLGYDFGQRPFSTYQYQNLRDRNAVFSGVCAFRPWRFGVAANGPAELAMGQLVSGNYFSMLGVNAVLGRTITNEDDRVPGANPVAVISYGYWERKFGRDPAAIGRSIKIQGRPFSIIGVTPRDFFGTEPGRAVDVTVPLMMMPAVMPGTLLLTERGAAWLRLMARLKPGVPEPHARANLQVVWAQILATEEQGWRERGQRIDLMPGGKGLDQLRRQFSRPLQLLIGIVSLVLLIACANVAGLLLARAAARNHEFTVRLALGAGRLRLLRQLLTESILLALLGGVAGVALAWWMDRVLVAIMSRGAPQLTLNAGPDMRALAFTVAVSIATGVLFGIAPAFRAMKFDVNSALKAAQPALAAGGTRFGSLMLVCQVAISCLLIIGAGLFVRTLRNLHAVDAGIRKDHVLLVSIRPGVAGYQGAGALAIYRNLYSRFSGLPGVQSVTLSMDTPLGGLSYGTGITVPGRAPQPGDHVSVYHNFVGPRFFETMGTPLLAGRDFSSRDDENAHRTAIVNESLARHYFPGVNPVGRRILLGNNDDAEIVAVAKDTKYESLRGPAPRMVYRPYLQVNDASASGASEEMWFAIRTFGSPAGLNSVVREAVRAAANDLPVYSLLTLDEQVDATLVQERVLAILSSCFGALALLLAAVGLYGRLAFAVARRTREIGVRVALGADPLSVAWMVFRESLAVVFAGLALGTCAALATARLIVSLLFGMRAADPLTYLIAAITLVAVSTFAAYLPARRAARVDPMVALRYE